MSMPSISQLSPFFQMAQTGIGQMGQGYQQSQNQQNMVQLGQALQNGDYAGAMAAASRSGNPDLITKIAGMKQDADAAKSAPGDINALMPGATSTTPGTPSASATPPTKDANFTLPTSAGVNTANLDPAFAGPVQQLGAELQKEGYNVNVNSGYRSTADQQRIYDSGIRPAAVPGHSYHEFGLATDFSVSGGDGKGYARMAALAPQFGLYPGANFGDPGHVQMGVEGGGNSLTQALMEQRQRGFSPSSGTIGTGDVSRGVANNNPGNIKFGQFAQTAGATGADAKGFAVFPDVQTGGNAQMALWSRPDYASVPIDQALKQWSNGGYGAKDFGLDPNVTFASLSQPQKYAVLMKQRQLEGTSGVTPPQPGQIRGVATLAGQPYPFAAVAGRQYAGPVTPSSSAPIPPTTTGAYADESQRGFGTASFPPGVTPTPATPPPAPISPPPPPPPATPTPSGLPSQPGQPIRGPLMGVPAPGQPGPVPNLPRPPGSLPSGALVQGAAGQGAQAGGAPGGAPGGGSLGGLLGGVLGIPGRLLSGLGGLLQGQGAAGFAGGGRLPGAAGPQAGAVPAALPAAPGTPAPVTPAPVTPAPPAPAPPAPAYDQAKADAFQKDAPGDIADEDKTTGGFDLSSPDNLGDLKWAQQNASKYGYKEDPANPGHFIPAAPPAAAAPADPNAVAARSTATTQAGGMTPQQRYQAALAGQVKYAGTRYAPVFEAIAKQAQEDMSQTNDEKNYNFAKSQGYTGTFEDWQSKEKTPVDQQEFEYAQKQGFKGSFMDFLNAKRQPLVSMPPGDTAFQKKQGELQATELQNVATKGQTSREMLDNLQVVNGALDQIEKGGGTTGPGSETVLDAGKLLNSITGDDSPVTDGQQVLSKMNTQLAGQAAKALGSRVTNFEFEQMKRAYPGLMNTVSGNRLLVKILQQASQRNADLGDIAASSGSYAEYQQKTKAYLAAPEHQLINPFTNQPFGARDANGKPLLPKPSGPTDPVYQVLKQGDPFIDPGDGQIKTKP